MLCRFGWRSRASPQLSVVCWCCSRGWPIAPDWMQNGRRTLTFCNGNCLMPCSAHQLNLLQIWAGDSDGSQLKYSIGTACYMHATQIKAQNDMQTDANRSMLISLFLHDMQVIIIRHLPFDKRVAIITEVFLWLQDIRMATTIRTTEIYGSTFFSGKTIKILYNAYLLYYTVIRIFVILTNAHCSLFYSKTTKKFQNAKRGTELDYVIAKKNPLFNTAVLLELWGPPQFAIRQKVSTPETTEGTVFLLGPLDFETQSMYRLTLLALVSWHFAHIYAIMLAAVISRRESVARCMLRHSYTSYVFSSPQYDNRDRVAKSTREHIIA